MEFTLFSGFRWQDALDILLNSYILFRLYVLFRGTNVFRVLVAVGGLWVFNRTAAFLGLIITNWAMQGVITAAALIVIIIFRNEISNVIQTNDLKSFFWGIPRYQADTPVSTIAQSVLAMAEKRIGALIVLPMKQGLESVVQGGVELDALLSQEALVSLFWPDNPLHDGAAVVEGDRIISAGVILPLTGRKDLPSYYGTRHRAAMGLSQLSDALVIVVSEERGHVTLCKQGQSFQARNLEDLTEGLQNHMGEDAPKKGFRQQSVELCIAGLVCLLVVSGTWLSFSRGMESLANFDIPIEFLNPEPKKEILSTSASKIKVMTSGARPLINALNPGQITVNLDLTRARVGENLLPIGAKNVHLPPGITLKSIQPNEVKIVLDDVVVKEFPVQVDWVGTLPRELILTRAETVPPRVRVSGGSLLLKDIATLFTAPVSLDGLSRSGVLYAGLALDHASLKLLNSDKVLIRYTLEERSPH